MDEIIFPKEEAAAPHTHRYTHERTLLPTAKGTRHKTHTDKDKNIKKRKRNEFKNCRKSESLQRPLLLLLLSRAGRAVDCDAGVAQ